MADTLTGFLTEIADAIREVEGSVGAIPAPTFPDRIRNLTVAVDFTRLATAIADATARKGEPKVAGSGDYDFGTEVTTQGAIDALAEAIATAQGVYDTYKTAPVTQALLNDAQEALEAAVKTFEASITEVSADTSELTAQQARLTTLKQGVSTSADGKDVTFGGKWVTSAEQAAVDAALLTAQDAVRSATKQSQINAAVSTLKSALDTYQAAIKTATKDTSALDAAISAANTAKKDVLTSDQEGADLPAGSDYVTTAEMQALEAAIALAASAKETSTNQNQIEAAARTLTEETEAFEAEVKTNWAPPEDIADASWDDIAKLADLAAAEPTGYKKYIGQEKAFTYGGYSVTARIVGIAQDTLRNGGKCGFTFHIYKGMGTHNMNGSDTAAGGYASTAMKTWLEGLAFPDDLAALLPEFEVKYRDGSNTGAAAKSLYAKVALMSASNLYWAGCQGNNGMQAYFYSDEGEPYQYFEDNDTLASRIHYNSSGGARNAWLLSPRSSTRFMRANSAGNADGSSASGGYVPSARFCLGSSI